MVQDDSHLFRSVCCPSDIRWESRNIPCYQGEGHTEQQWDDMWGEGHIEWQWDHMLGVHQGCVLPIHFVTMITWIWCLLCVSLFCYIAPVCFGCDFRKKNNIKLTKDHFWYRWLPYASFGWDIALKFCVGWVYIPFFVHRTSEGLSRLWACSSWIHSEGELVLPKPFTTIFCVYHITHHLASHNVIWHMRRPDCCSRFGPVLCPTFIVLRADCFGMDQCQKQMSEIVVLPPKWSMLPKASKVVGMSGIPMRTVTSCMGIIYKHMLYP